MYLKMALTWHSYTVMVMQEKILLKTLTFSEKCYAVSKNNEHKILEFFNHAESCLGLDFVAF